MKKTQIALISTSFVIVLIAIVVAFSLFNQPSESNNTSTNSPQNNTSSSESASKEITVPIPNPAMSSEPYQTNPISKPTALTKYRNGSYTAKSSYRTPSSSAEPISITVTISEDLITSLTIAEDSSDTTSEFYKKKFSEGIQGIIVGKSVDTVSPDKVNGSSLTANGFNKALEEIQKNSRTM